MKKSPARMSLHRETLRLLDSAAMRDAAAGATLATICALTRVTCPPATCPSFPVNTCA